MRGGATAPFPLPHSLDYSLLKDMVRNQFPHLRNEELEISDGRRNPLFVSFQPLEMRFLLSQGPEIPSS